MRLGQCLLCVRSGRYHRMMTPEEDVIGLWLCKRCIEIVASKWIDICWTPFFRSPSGVCASVVREVFIHSWWHFGAERYIACDYGGCLGGGPLAVQQVQNSTGPVCRSGLQILCVLGLQTHPRVCAHTQQPVPRTYMVILFQSSHFTLCFSVLVTCLSESCCLRLENLAFLLLRMVSWWQMSPLS